MAFKSLVRRALVQMLTESGDLPSSEAGERASRERYVRQSADDATRGGGWCARPTKYDAICCKCARDVPAGEGRFRPYGRGEIIQVHCLGCASLASQPAPVLSIVGDERAS